MDRRTQEILVEIDGVYHWYESNCETVCREEVEKDDKLVLPPYRKYHLAMCPDCIQSVLPQIAKMKTVHSLNEGRAIFNDHNKD